MRVAVLSDIHGNPVALDAVLADIERQGGVDAYWVLGDLVALGYDPVGVLERLARLSNSSCTRGNTDRALLSDADLIPTAEELADRARLPRIVQLAQNHAWTLGALNGTDWHARLSALPLEKRTVLEDGTRVLGVHASPGRDDGEGIHPLLSQGVLRELFRDCAADLVFVGHTHWAMDIRVDATRVINLGSLSLPFPPDLRAKYTLLESDAQGYRVEHRRVEYDRLAVMDAVEQTRNPAREFILRSLRGENRPGWAQNLSAAEAERLDLPPAWATA
jgi:predicted phosphodiesterase